MVEANFSNGTTSTTQIWVVARHQYGISVLVSQTSFHGETCGGVAECRLFCQAKSLKKPLLLAFSHLEEVCLHKGRTIRKLMG